VTARAKHALLTPQGAVVAMVLVFLAISAWWLTRDLRVINLDNAKHANVALQWHTALTNGDLLEPLRVYNVYPPGTHIIGALGSFVFGFNVPATVMAENLVFVPLLALGCYGTGTVAFGRVAGVLAALFALSVPLVMAMFHQFLPDAPMAAMVAVSVWLLLASDRFARLPVTAAAGLALGLGMYTKGTFSLFVVGILAMLVLRGGWRNWKGVLVCAGVAAVLAVPYYIDQFSSIRGQADGFVTGPLPVWYGSVPFPTRTSVANYTWYFWNLVNNQLYLPLALFFFTGVGWALWRLVRTPRAAGYLPELLAGGLVGYLAISMLVLKDPRYTLPCLVYVAVISTAWITSLHGRARQVAIGALIAIGVVNTVSHNLSIGGDHSISLPMAVDSPIGQYKFRLINENGFFTAAPSREAEPIVRLLNRLDDQGVPRAVFDPASFSTGGYHLTGLSLLALQSREEVPGFSADLVTDRKVAWIVRADVAAVGRKPCLMSPLVRDGTGIYVYRGRVPRDISRARVDCP
jgi:hypothetical protein